MVLVAPGPTIHITADLPHSCYRCYKIEGKKENKTKQSNKNRWNRISAIKSFLKRDGYCRAVCKVGCISEREVNGIEKLVTNRSVSTRQELNPVLSIL
jgi:ferredoxin